MEALKHVLIVLILDYSYGIKLQSMLLYSVVVIDAFEWSEAVAIQQRKLLGLPPSQLQYTT